MDYLILLIEFFFIQRLRSIIQYLFIPICIGWLIFFKADDCVYIQNAVEYQTNAITILGIIIGFTISTFAILLTVNSRDISAAKAKLTGKRIFSKEISVFDTVLIGLAYVIFIQNVLLIANFIYPVFISVKSLCGKLAFSVNIAVMIHILLILMNSVLDTYFILTKKAGK